MGELFDRHLPAENLEWTGERLVGSVRGQVEAEHIHRYFFARQLCRGLDVLDIASGEGYGSALIAQTARSVIGVEIDPAAVAHARTAYPGERLEFRQGDARAIPLDDASIDCVVSFETIEHFYDHAGFMAEIDRVLRPGGFLLISSPDRDIYSPSGGHVNVHHLNELTREEFQRTLSGKFANVALLAQRPIVGSVLVGNAPVGADPITFERRKGQRFEASEGIARPLYWVALASNTALPALPDSFFFEDIGLDAVAEIPLLRERADHARRETDEVRQAHDHVVAKLEFERGELARLRREREAEHRISIAQAGELGAMDDRLVGAHAQIDLLQQKLDEVGQVHAQVAALTEQLETMQAEAAKAGRLSDRGTELIDGRSVASRNTHFAELATLRGQLDRYEREASPAKIAELRRMQVAVLGSLRRPLPVDVLPADVPASNAADYLTLAQSLLFDRDWYLANYADVAAVGIDPVLHYLHHGWREGRQPGPGFDGDAYLAGNADVAKGGINPLVHYLRYGVVEARPIELDRNSLHALPTPGDSPRFWFFAGDTIDWINHHSHLTGVGHVTSELLFAAISVQCAESTLLCVRGSNVSGLVRLDRPEPIRRLAQLAGRPVETDPLGHSANVFARHPAPGDHIFFTGVVWTESYAVLFRHLADCGIRFSVLIHDIIPIVEPDLVTDDYARTFIDWLTVTLKTASAIHVSNDIVRHQILRWAVAARISPSARIETIAFGVRLLPQSDAQATSVLTRVNARFVLCVGTIDIRKNQRMLVQVWHRLSLEFGMDDLPQLVLAGRDDLNLQGDPELADVFASSKVVLLEGLDDLEVAALYRACLFTVFPSTSEGYGMPVAESLGYGRLCISSALPEVQAHAGDFAWYFEPGSADAMRVALKRAILSPEGPKAASARIDHEFDPPRWVDAFQAMRAAACTAMNDPLVSLDPPPGRFAGTVEILAGETLARAETWCTDDAPDVSILIVNWNAAALTRDCIRQIWAKTVGTRYQIIIVDNGSVAADLQRLRGLGNGVSLIENGCNRYFGEANNIAAERATGRYLCLLNNDAFVEDGWLDALLAPLRDQPDIGATGPMFLFPDGRVQEAGATVDAEGYPIRLGRDGAGITSDLLEPKVVDYISAAALVVERSLFYAVGGFDLGYEPAYYEDTDFCLKLRAFGRKVLYCPEARVIHIEGSSANSDSAAEEARKHMGDLNRGKFVARWGDYLRGRDEASLARIKNTLPLSPVASSPTLPADAPTAVVFTPYPLTPGGGERYLLSIVALLTKTHRVSVATTHPYSALRLHSLGSEFGLDLTQVHIITDPRLDTVDAPDIQVVMANHIIPPVFPRGRLNIFHCQFPFPLAGPPSAEDRARLAGYDRIIVNSRFTSMHTTASLDAFQLPAIAVDVVPPPVPQLAAGVKTHNRILSVGRFFRGGHSKRHDLLIEAFRQLVARSPEPVELHIAGSSTPHNSDMLYLTGLMESARDLPVHFHVNISSHNLEHLYAGASIYWHGTGLGANLIASPWEAEHFGITVVEAMSAGVVPFALASGGPRETIHHGINGFLYDTPDTLVEQTLAFLSETQVRRDAMRAAARKRAAEFAPARFDGLIETLTRSPAARIGKAVAIG